MKKKSEWNILIKKKKIVQGIGDQSLNDPPIVT